jgi:serine/threonine protein kinase
MSEKDKNKMLNPSSSTQLKLNNRYAVQCTLGKSKYEVKRAIDTSNGNKTVALKIFPRKENGQSLCYLREYNAYSSFDHPNVLKMVDHFPYQDNTMKPQEIVTCDVLVLEFAGKKDLYEYAAKTGRFSEMETKYIFFQLVQGVQHIHSKGISHMDLKLENIYVDDNSEIKLADFDLARPVIDTFTHHQIGSPGYYAPEILERRPFQGQYVDVFTLGIILFSLVVGCPPFFQANQDDPYYKYLRRGQVTNFWRLWEMNDGFPFITEDLKQLITSLLAYRVEKRPSLDQIINCQWLKGKMMDPEAFKMNIEERYDTMISEENHKLAAV